MYISVMFPHWTLTVETCDERTIPGVNHATYEIYRFMSVNATTNPPSHGQNFSVPDYVYVTYTCEAGYHLQDPKNNVIGCEYVTKQRVRSKNVTAKAVWTSTDSITCEEGEEQRNCKCWNDSQNHQTSQNNTSQYCDSSACCYLSRPMGIPTSCRLGKQCMVSCSVTLFRSNLVQCWSLSMNLLFLSLR